MLDWVITDQYRKKGKDQSPILWGDLDRTKARVFWAPPSCFRTFTLGAVLNEVSRREGNLFFRKVGPLTAAETERVLAPILLPTPASAPAPATKEKEKEPVPTSLSRPASLSGESHDTDVPRWEPASDGEPPSTSSSSSASAASPARSSSSSSYAEPEVDDDEEEEEELQSVEASFSSASSVPTSRSPSPLAAEVAAARMGKEEEGDDVDAPSVPSTPQLHRLRARPPSRAEAHKRLAAEAALSDVEEREGEDGDCDGGSGEDVDEKGIIPARRNLRMVGPPGRCANGRC